MITVKEIARMCDVSASTVSNILNGRPNVSEQTKQRVLKVIKETGYQPNYFASSMRKQNTRMICIIAEDLCRFGTASVVDAAMAYCGQQGYRTMLMNLRLYDRRQPLRFREEDMLVPVLKEVQSLKAEGIIYAAGHGRIIKSFPREFTLPTLIVYAAAEEDRFPAVMADDEKSGYDMIKYLTSMGHREIGIIAGESGNVQTGSRLAGCRRALLEEGISYHPERIVYGRWDRRSGYDGAARLADTGVTAVWCMNDLMAGGVYDYAHGQNIVIGRELSVAGYGDMEIAQFMYPQLTTMRLPLEEMGRSAAAALLKMLEGETENLREPMRLPCEMRLRDSVCRIG